MLNAAVDNIGFSPNSSGFHSFPIASIYPNYGSGFNQTADTIPEAAEQAAYTSGDNSAPVVSNPSQTKGILIFVLILLVLFAVMGGGR